MLLSAAAAVRGSWVEPAIVPCVSCAGNEVCRRATSSRAPDLQVAAPGARGEAARALGTAVACARPRTLRAWPSASQAAWEAAVTRRVLGATIVLGSPSPCKRLCVFAGLRPVRLFAGGSAGRRTSSRRRRESRPRLPGGRATRRSRGRERACRPAGAPQRHAVNKLVANQATESW
jgi:hypothetical protein